MSDTLLTPRTDAAWNSDVDGSELEIVSKQLERELNEKTNEVARLRESLDRYEDIINKQDDELIKLRQVAVKLYGYAWDNVPDDYQSLYGILNELYEEIGPLAPSPEELKSEIK